MIGLVDCNAFFCNCERLFRPDLRRVPVVVLSNNDGCVISRTPGAKRLGIKMGQPFFEVRKLCKQQGVAVFSSNFTLYTDISKRVMNVLGTFTDELEVYSVDEAFLSLTGQENLYGGFSKRAEHIAKEVYRQVGIPVTVGVAPTKTMAKAATTWAKKRFLYSQYFHEKNLHLLRDVEIDDVWGIGRKQSVKLLSLGVRNAWDFRNYKNETLIRKMLTIKGLQTKKELMGQRCFNIELEGTKKKEISCSRMFGKPVTDINKLREAVAHHISSAAGKLRKQNSFCGGLGIYVQAKNYLHEPVTLSRSLHLPTATQNTAKMISAMMPFVDQLYSDELVFRKAGAFLFNLSDYAGVQEDLFTPTDSLNDKNLMAVMDAINKKQGKGTLKFAACGTERGAWSMKRDHLSPQYVTSFSDLPKCS